MKNDTVETMKKYRLGNQPETYELKEDYLGWTPKRRENWEDLRWENIANVELTIINQEDKTEKNLFLHGFISKDTFPLSFWREARSEQWYNFAIVSETRYAEKYIIPLH